MGAAEPRREGPALLPMRSFASTMADRDLFGEHEFLSGQDQVNMQHSPVSTSEAGDQKTSFGGVVRIREVPSKDILFKYEPSVYASGNNHRIITDNSRTVD